MRHHSLPLFTKNYVGHNWVLLPYYYTTYQEFGKLNGNFSLYMKERLMAKDQCILPVSMESRAAQTYVERYLRGGRRLGRHFRCKRSDFRAYFHPDPNHSDFHRAAPKTFVQNWVCGSEMTSDVRAGSQLPMEVISLLLKFNLIVFIIRLLM